LSGTYNSAVQAASQFDDGAVTVIDAGTASVGHMLQVIAAAEEASSPDATAESVAEAARNRAGNGYGFAMVDTLEYLQKGGRIGKAQAFMGSLLKVKPILKVANGEVLPVDRPRNVRRGLQRLEELVREQGPVSKLAAAYTTDAAPAEEMRNRLSDVATPENTYTVQIGSAIGTHVGPGAVVVSTLP
jgi:DegV family protein with EDD domain